MRYIFIFFINLTNKQTHTNTNNYPKILKIAHQGKSFYFAFFGSNSHIGQKSRAYTFHSLRPYQNSPYSSIQS